MLEFLYSTGARISEAVGLDVDDSGATGTPDEGTVPGVRLFGKGSKERIVPIGSYAPGPWTPTWCAAGRRWPPRARGPRPCS